jgi:hypothetical protein
LGVKPNTVQETESKKQNYINMKKQKISLLALAVLAGGITAASAATPIYRSYQLFINTTNSTRIWDVWGIAQPVSGFPSVQQNVNVDMDSSGKIIGSGFIRLDFNTNNAPYAGYTVDVTGKAKTKNNLADISLKAKGPGGLVNGDGTAETGSIDLQFTGQPGPNPFNTNFAAIIVGKLNGNIKGKSPLGSKTAKFQNVIAGIPNSSPYNPLSGFDIGVLQADKKQQFFGSEFTGNGSIKNNTWKGSIKGIGWSKGSKVNINGNLGLYTNNISTNAIAFAAPSTFAADGKIQGQSFKGAALQALGEINAQLVY